MSRYKLFIFDFDGTLVDTAPDITHYINEIFISKGLLPNSIEDVKNSIGWGVHELVQKLAAKQSVGLSAADLEVFVSEFKDNYRKAPSVRSRPYEGVMEMLSGELSSVEKSIVTNKPHELTVQILKELNMERFFKTVIGTGIGYDPKPSILSTEETMKLMNASKHNTLFIGDSRIDQETAKRAEVDFAWMTYGYDKAWESEPEYVFNSAFEWRTILNEHV
ncbi:MAG: HAD hydrolase-like protein, partial [Candidatus Omnitrophica bacterium]|nr:HAD hydrolase-like protein [Candidatus Omnitrophota bacterium]